ncbi:MAG: succinylglutamate desuccinylase/aspartoacylase family protein [bacterium]
MNHIHDCKPPLLVDELDIAGLPGGRIGRLMLKLVHDDFGWPLRLPILVARGAQPGKTLGLIAAVHGNEVNGIPVIHKLFAQLDPRRLRGTLIAVVVMNVPGFHVQQREFSDGVDLNDIMPGKLNGNASEVYVRNFVDQVVRHCDYLVDLHTASVGRHNSLYLRADLLDPVTAQMAYFLRPPILLHNPPADGTLRGTAQDIGIPAITLEIGNPQRFQPQFIRQALAGLGAVLIHTGLMPGRPAKVGAPPLICERSHWMYTDFGGLLEVYPDVMETVRAGELIASLTNIHGDKLRDYRAPEDAVVIGKSVNPVSPTGARIAHLGIVSRPGSPLLKAATRRAS